ncbi:hypothetical protein AXF42_Ash008804 [Apostasia shenzhenica]|uniref:Uncharacterized protein n=1 Tax=Apostasia shenzhenica TaxID=1088818 RepID=A0A2I0ASK3_9ASPA|nr:hypothetical protein AXF42_Ash008804 [Apostasia shenzhenica]
MLRLFRLKPSLHFHCYSSAGNAAPNPHRRRAPIVTDPTLTLYFLQNSCSLSPSAAASAAEKINIKSTKNPHAVVSLLRDHGFGNTQIARLISRRPKLLLASPNRTLKPKFDFYASIGLSGPEFTDMICTRDRFFIYSINRRLVPNLRHLRSLFPSDFDVPAAVRRFPALIVSNLQKVSPVGIKTLRDFGAPEASILKLLAGYPTCLMKCPKEIRESLAAAMAMGADSSKPNFVHVFVVMMKVPTPERERRIQNYVRMGWSREMVIRIFIQHPYCLSSSSEKVEKNVKFFAEKLNWGPEKMSASPVLLSLSLARRIIPRFSVVKRLEEKGLLKVPVNPNMFIMVEKRFREVYVERNKEMLPEILKAYDGNA